MNKKVRLLTQMIAKGAFGVLLVSVPLFGCAGTLRYRNAWVVIGSLCVWMLSFGIILLIKHPEILEGRLRTRESETAQKGYMALIGLSFLASFVLAGLDYRFGWSGMPFAVSAIAWGVMLIGYVLYSMVVLQNAYASRVVEIQKGQRVISTGLYSLVRHPMYLAAILLFLAMPLVLGSYIALLPMLVFPALMALRIRNEEAVLLSGLEGYAEYLQKTRYRLIPYIW